MFSKSEPRVIRGRLQDFIADASKEQIRAWDDSIPWLQRECRELAARDPASGRYTAILEYELPRDSRRPDVVVLHRGSVAVLELKGHLHASQAAVDQALGYARDLAAYHAACAGKTVVPILVTRGTARYPIIRGRCLRVPSGISGRFNRDIVISAARRRLGRELSRRGCLRTATIDRASRTRAISQPPSSVYQASSGTHGARAEGHH